MTDMRTMYEADQESLQDTAEWLNRLDQEAFDRNVQSELRGVLDPQACEALRHPMNLKRWRTTLTDLAVDLQRQLTLPEGKAPEKAAWRAKVLFFHAGVLRRRNEVDHLRRQRQSSLTLTEREARAAEKPLRAEAGEAAVQRLIEVHRAEFLALLGEEYERVGVGLRDSQLREIAELRGAVLRATVPGGSP